MNDLTVPPIGTGPVTSPFDAIVHTEPDGRQWWSAREMMKPMGYLQWRSMEHVIERAEAACRNVGHHTGDHFARARKMIGIGSKTQRGR